MGETDHRRIAHGAAVIDAGMAVGIDQDIILGAGQGGDNAEIGLVAGGKDHGVFGAVEFF